MEMIELLETLKGKKLDDTRYELLRQAIELRQDKMQMLGKANEILEENNLLLKEKIRYLEREIALMRSGAETRVLAPAEPQVGSPRHIQEISDMSVAILRECLRRNRAVFNAAEMSAFLASERSEVEKSLAELVESGLLERQISGSDEPTHHLTAAGRSYGQTLTG